MSRPYLSIIIPAYNEALRIPKTLLGIDAALHKADFSYEIIVVSDGSSDNTAAIVSKMADVVRNLKVIDLKENVGKGGAVREGMLAAKGVVMIFTDADNSTSIDQFEHMIPFFKEGYSVVIGSRAVPGARLDPPEPFYRQIIGKALNLVVQVILLPGIWDTQCGFKAFTAEAAEAIFSKSKIGGWGFDVELLALAKRMEYRIKEIPVYWVNDERSTVHFSAGPRFLADIARIRWWFWRGLYDVPKPLNMTSSPS
jgi:glycosyltransferase involved in cell wall biosynthesis